MLNTLDDAVFRDGCAEVIKYAVLYDTYLFDHLLEQGINFDRAYVISRCIELKRNVVKADEFDRGARQMLNLGHTIGHGIEAQSHYTVSHGSAVAAGMAIVAKASAEYGFCDISVYRRICRILDLFRLPKDTGYTAEALYTSALSDKKRSGSSVNMIVPLEIGRCTIKKLSTNSVKTFIEAGL